MPRWFFGFDSPRRKRRKKQSGRNSIALDLGRAVQSFHQSRLLAIEPLEDRRLLLAGPATTLTVNTISDAHALNAASSPYTDASDDISLRSAIEYLNATTDSGYSINFAPSLTASGSATIDLTFGQIEIAESVSIDGPGANLLTIDQTTSGGARVFQVDTSATVLISGLTVSGGNANGATSPANDGGGILNEGSLALHAVTLSNNTALEHGGGIYNLDGDLLVSDSTISGNAATNGDGGGIFNNAGTLNLINSTLAGNSAAANGGGLDNSGTATITGGTFSVNSANAGGGIYNDSIGGVTANVANTIVAGNSVSGPGANDPDVFGGFATTDHNLIGELGDATGFSGNGNMIANTDNTTTLGLAALADNGGPTQTMALLPGSPALTAGNPSPAAPFATPTTDQRGLPRTVGGKIDIGAYQTQSAPLTYSTTSAGDYTLKLVAGLLDLFDANGSLVGQSTDGRNAATITNNSGDPMMLTVDYSGGGPLPSGGLSFIGGGNDTLHVTGFANGATISETFTGSSSGTVQVGTGGAITYSGLSPVLIDGGTPGNVNFTLPANAHALLKDNGGGTPELVSTNAIPVFESTTFPLGTTSLTINGGGGDTITTDASFTGDFTGSLTINGTATDTVNLGALTLSDSGANLTITGQTIIVGGNVTTSGGQTYGDAVSLGAAVTLQATAGGDIEFQKTLDGGYDLTVNTSGATKFDNNVGQSTPLNSLTTDSAGTTVFDDANAIITNNNQTYNDPVTVQSGVSLSSGGTIAFAAKVDGSSGLEIATGNATFAAAVGSVTPLDSLTTDNLATAAFNGGLVKTANAQTYGGDVTVGADTTFTSTSNAQIDFQQDLNGSHAVVVNTTGKTSFAGGVGSSNPLASLTTESGGTVSIGGGSSSSAGDIQTGGAQSYGGNVTLGANTSLFTASAAADVEFNGKLDSATATPENLTINSGGNVNFNGPVGSAHPLGIVEIVSANNVTLGDTFAADKLVLDNGTLVIAHQLYAGASGTIIVQAPAIQVTANQNFGAGNVVFVTNSLTFSASLTGTGKITIQAATDADSIDINPTIVGSGLNLTSAAIFNQLSGFSQIIIGGSMATGIFTVNAATTLSIPVEFSQQSGGAGKVFINGTLTDTAPAAAGTGITINGSGHTTTLNADMITNGTAIVINDSIILGAPNLITLDTTNGGLVAAGAAIAMTMPGTIDDDFADTSALVLNGGITGVVTLGGAIGSATPIKSLSITGATIDLNGGSITTAHDQTYTGAVVLGTATVLNSTGDNSTGGNIAFTNKLDGGQALTVTAGAGNVGLGGAVGTTPLASLTISPGAGTTTLDANVSTVGAQDYGQAAVLGATLTLTTGLLAGDNVTFEKTLDATTSGGQSLTVTTGAGNVNFDGAVGTTPLAGLVITAGSGTTTLKANVSTTGAQNYGQAVVLGSTLVTLTTAEAAGDDVAFAGTVDSDGTPRSLDLNAANVAFNGSVGTSPLAALTINGSGATMLGGATAIAVTTTGAQFYGEPVTLGNAAALIGSQATFQNTIAGGGNTLVITGSAEFDAAVTNLAALAVSGATAINTSAVTTTVGGQTYGGMVTLGANTVLTAPAGFPVAFNNSLIGANHSLKVAGDAVLGGAAVNSLTGLTTLEVTGAATINAGGIATTSTQSYDGAVTLGANTTLAGSAVTFQSTIGGGGNSLTVNGNAAFEGAVTGLTTLEVTGATAINTGAITTSGSQSYDGNTTLAAGTTLSTTNSAVTFGGTLDGTQSVTIAAGTGNVTFGGNVGAGTALGDVTISNAGNVTAKGNFQVASLTETSATLTTELDGAVTVSGLAGLGLKAATGINLKGPSIVSTSVSTAPIHLVGAVTLLGNLTIDTSLGGGGVSFSNTLDSAANQSYSLTVNTGAYVSVVDFNQAVGGATNGALGAIVVNNGGTTLFNASVQAASLTTGAAGLTRLNGNVTTTVAQTYGDPVNLLANVNLTGALVTLSQSLQGGGKSLQITGSAAFDGVVSAASTISVSGATAINAGEIHTVTGGQTYGGTVTLGANAILAAPGGSPVTFNAPVVGANHSLEVNGDAVFGSVTTDTVTGVTTLLVTGSTTINTGNIASTGAQTYQGAVTLGANTTLAGIGATFESMLAGGGNSLLVDGGAEFDGAVTGLNTLEVTGVAVISSPITTSGDQSYDGTTFLGADTTLTTTNSPVTFGGVLAGTQALTIAAGSGDIAFDGNVGAGTALGAISITDGGNVTAFGSITADSFSQTAGSGTTTFSGNVTLSSAAGLQVSAALIDLQQIVVTAAQAVFTGPVELTGNATVDTPAAGGAITFNSTLNSDAPATPRNLTLAAGAGNITFTGAVGAAAPLGGLLIESAATVDVRSTLNAASFTQLSGSGTFTINQSVTLTGAAGLNINSATIDVQAATISTTAALAPVLLNGAVVLTGDATITTGGGPVTFQGTVDTDGTHAYNLTVNSSGVTTFAGRVGDAAANTALGTITTDAAGATNINADVVNAATLDFQDAVVVGANATLTAATSATFGNTVDTNGQMRNLTVLSPSTTLSGRVGAGGPFGTLTFDGTSAGAGTTTIDTDRIAGSAIAFNNPVVLETDSAVQGTAAVTFAGTLNTDGAPHNLTVDSALTTFQGEVGTTANGALGTLTVDGVSPGGGLAIINTDALDASQFLFNNAVSLAASTTLTGTDVAFAKTIDGAFALHVANSGTATFDGVVGPTNALASLTIDGVSTLAGGAVNTTGAQTYTGAVTLAAAAVLTSNASGAIAFDSTINGDGNGPWSLTVNTAGTTTFGGFVGGAHPLRSLTTDAAGSTVFSIAGSTPATPAITTAAAQTYNDAVTLSANTDLIAGGNIVFGNTVSGAFHLHTSATGTTAFDNTVGLAPANYLTTITIDGASEVAANTINTTGKQTYTGPMVLDVGGTSIVSTASGALIFGGTVTGVGNALTVTSDGTTTFNGNVSVNSLTATSAVGTTAFAATVSSVTSVGTQTYNDRVTLGTGATAFASTGNANITFGGTMTGTANDLAVSSNGTTTFDGNVNVKSLTATSATGTTAFGAAVTSASSVNAQTYNDAVTFAAAATTLTSTSGGDITFNGTVNGAVALEVDSFGNEIFNAPVGALTALSSLTTDGSATIGVGGQARFNAASSMATPSVTTTGAQTYNDAAQLGADTVLTTTSNGPITFADTLDSDAVMPRNMTLSAGTGDITFDKNVGATHPLNNLLIQSAGAVAFDGTLAVASITQLAGASFTFDQNVTVTGAAGVSVTAAAIDVQGITLQTTASAAPISLLGPVVLTGNATITTNSGNVLFGGTLDSEASKNYGLTVNAAAGNVTFQGAVGSAANGALGAIAVNSTSTTRFNSTAAAASLTTDVGGLTQLNGNVVTTGAQTYNDNVEVDAATLVLSATNSPVFFAGTVNSAANGGNTASLNNSLTINAGNGAITFQGAVGGGMNGTLSAIAANSGGTTRFNSTVNAASLATDSGGLTQLNGNVTTTGAQTYGDSVEVDATALVLFTTNSPVSFAGTVNSAANGGNTASLNNALTVIAGTGNVSFQQAVGGGTNGALGAIVINSGGTTLFNNTVNAASVTTDAAGQAQLNGNVTTSGSQAYNDPVSLLSGVTVDSSAGGGNISFGATLDGSQNLNVNTGSGNVLFVGAVGSGAMLGAVTIANANNVTAQSGFKAASLTQTAGTGTTELDATVTVSGAVGLALTTNAVKLKGPTITAGAGPVTVHAPVSLIGNLAIDTTGGSDVTFGQTLDGTFSLTVTSGRDLLFDGAVGGNSPLGPIVVHTARNVTALATITADSFEQLAGTGTTTFNGNVTTSGLTGVAVTASAIDLQAITVKTTAAAAPVNLQGSVTLTGNTLINTAAGGGAITFGDTLDGTQTLGLAAGTGNITFVGAVGTTPLSDVTITSANNVTAQGAFTAASLTQTAGTGTTELDGAVTVSDATGLSLTTAAVKLKGPTITAGAGPVNFAAPVILTGNLSIDTSVGNAPITFGQTLDGAENLSLKAGTGNIVFAGAVGGGTPLSDVTITNAGNVTAQGSFSAASLTQLAGGSTTDLDGAVTVSDTTGLVLTGNAVNLKGPTITATAATAAPVTLNAPVTLIGNVVIDTSAGSGAVSINGALNSAANKNYGLTVSTGTGNVSFQQAVGGGTNGALGAIVVSSGGTTLFNAAVNAASVTTDAAGQTRLNGNITTTGPQTYNDPVSLLSAATTLASSGGGDISFAQTLDGASALTVNTAGATIFNGAVGGNAPLTSIATDSPGATAINGGSVTTSGAQSYGDKVTLGAAATTLTSTGGGNISFGQTVDGASALMVNTAGATIFNGAVGGTTPLVSMVTDSPGTTAINGGAVTTRGVQTYNDNVTLGAAATAIASLSGGNITFAQTLDGASAFTVNTAGTIAFNGAVGNAAALTSLATDPAGTTAINGGAVTTTAAQSYGDSVTLGAAATTLASTGSGNIAFAQTLDGASALTIDTAGATVFGGVVGGNTALVSIATDSPGTTAINGGSVTTSDAQSYGDKVTLGAAATTLASTGGGNIGFGQTLDGASALTVNTAGATIFGGAVGGTTPLASIATDLPGSTDIDGGSVTTSGAQSYGDKVTLGAAATALTSTGAGNISLSQTLDGASALTVNTAGATVFNGAVGRATPLASLLTDAPGTTNINGGGVTTSGDQTLNDNVTLGADTVFTATAGGDITFNGSLNSDATAAKNVTISTGGNVAFGDGSGNDAVGGLQPLATLIVSGKTTFNAAASSPFSPSVLTNGVQTYNGPVVLAADTVLTTLKSGNAVFYSTVDAAAAGGQSLTIDTTGDRVAGAFGLTQFNANVGGSAALKSLAITTGGPFSVNNSVAIKTTGDVNVVVAENNPGVAGDDINVQSGGALQSSAGNVSLRAGDNVTIAGSVAANGNVILQGDYNNNDPTPGTVINISGAMQAAAVSVSGGNGNDTINLTGVIQAPSVAVNDGSGNDAINVQKTASGTITTINAGPGGDTINISSSAPNAGGTLANIAGQIVVNGGASDILNVYDDGDTNTSATGDLTSASLTGFGIGAGMTYQGGLKAVNLRLGGGANLTLNVHSTAAATPVYVLGQGGGTVNVGDNNLIAGVAGTLDVTSVRTLNLNDQNSDRGQTYDITNEAVARPGTSPQVLVLYHKVGTVAVNSGNQTGNQLVDDTFNLFLPTATDLPLSATLKFDGGTSPSGYHNTLNVIASQSSTPTGFTYHAHVGLFGGSDPIQVQNLQVLHMYGSPVDSNDFANDANVSSVIIGGINADTLVGGLGQDIIFGGGDTANAGDQLVGGGGGNLDFIFAEFRPRFNADGSVSFVQFPGSGNTVINAGGGAAVSLTPNTNINNASSVIQVNGRIDVVTWLTARFTSPSSTGSIFEQALSTDPVLSGLQAPPAGPAPVPVAPLGSPTPAPTIAQLTQYVKSAYQDVLGRAADPSSLNAAVNALANGLSRGAFAASLTHSAEYYAVNVVIPAYQNYLNRAPDAAGLAFWINRLQSGLTDEQLEAGFISSDEFYATQGQGTNSGWIDALYTKLLGRPADSAGKTYWLAQLAGGESRMQVALDFTTSLEREAQRVTYDYEHFLRRAPEPAGITYWVQQFAHGVTNEDLVSGFVSSDEYFAESLSGNPG